MWRPVFDFPGNALTGNCKFTKSNQISRSARLACVIFFDSFTIQFFGGALNWG
jgi:hypothetical protein